MKKTKNLTFIIFFVNLTQALPQNQNWQSYQQQQFQQYRRFNDPYTLPNYDRRSAYYWNGPHNPIGPNYMFKPKPYQYNQNQGSDAIKSNKTVTEIVNDPDSRSGLHKPSSPNKVKLVVIRPNNDWSLFDWEIVLNGKFYAPIEAREYKILEIEPGQYDMTCGTMGVGTCIRFKANGGSTQYVTAEWERFTILPTDEGEALFKQVQKNKDSASKLTPSSSSQRSKYSTR